LVGLRVELKEKTRKIILLQVSFCVLFHGVASVREALNHFLVDVFDPLLGILVDFYFWVSDLTEHNLAESLLTVLRLLHVLISRLWLGVFHHLGDDYQFIAQLVYEFF
jgi:hypothetical protein